MIIKTAILDSAEYADIFTNYIQTYERAGEDKYLIHHYEDGGDILAGYKKAAYDLIFFDIVMPRIDGMTAAREIRRIDNDVKLIMSTSVRDYAVQGYSLEASGFLLKPVGYPDFCEQIKKASERIKSKKRSYILFPSGSGIVRTEISSIYYLECINHKIRIHTADGAFVTSGRLIDFEERLAAYNFFRCGKSYLINLGRVAEVRGSEVVLGGGGGAVHKIYVSRSKKKDFISSLDFYIKN